jgi:hypothetical protein
VTDPATTRTPRADGLPAREAPAPADERSPLEVARRIVEAAEDKKAADIVLLELGELTTVADYFVICSGGSERQIGAIADGVGDRPRVHAARARLLPVGAALVRGEDGPPVAVALPRVAPARTTLRGEPRPLYRRVRYLGVMPAPERPPYGSAQVVGRVPAPGRDPHGMSRLRERCPGCSRKLIITRFDTTFRLPDRSERLCFGIPGGLCEDCHQLYIDPDLIELLDLSEGRCVFAIESDLVLQEQAWSSTD